MGFLAFPQIDVNAVRAGKAREAQLWYGARAADRVGRGVIPTSAIGRHLSRVSHQRCLLRGDGVFWTVADRKAFLFSQARVAQALDVPRVSVVYRAQSAWLHERSLLTVCAQAFLGGLAVLRDGRPIAVATMARLAGRSVRTIRTWLQRTQWGRITNVALLEQVAQVGDGLRMGASSRDGRIMRIEHKGGVWLAARLPNSLEIHHQRVQKRAALRRVNARLPSQYGDKGHQPRRYIMPGWRRPQPAAQDAAYSLYDHLQLPEQVQLWLPPRSPELMGAVFERVSRESSAEGRVCVCTRRVVSVQPSVSATLLSSSKLMRVEKTR
jgi:hypothetical protein